jgi:sporulation protein YlmC with PRC-barrel domain
MYAQASQLQSLPVISLQTGETVASTRQLILDISTLEILAFKCEGPRRKQPLVLLSRDVRQLAADCIIIDNEDELADPADIVRLGAMLAANYNPIDKTVISDTGRKLGRVEDYSVNLETSRVQKLNVRQSILRSWLGVNLVIDRTQIIDISPKSITVRDSTVKASIMQTKSLPDTST